MGVGFSVTVDGDHARIRAGIEQQTGRPLTCKNSDGVRACEIQLAPQKTVILMTDQDGRSRNSLLGCYYFYAQ